MNPYKKECRFTFASFLVVVLLTNIYPLYFMFPQITKMNILGFPAHYFLAMFMGWVVLVPFFWFYIKVSENIDREIEDSAQGEEK